MTPLDKRLFVLKNMADELDFTRRHFVIKSFASWVKTAANMDDIANEILVT